MIAFDQPLVLLLLALVPLPLLRQRAASGHPALRTLPSDGGSKLIAGALPALGATGIAAIVIALGGPGFGGGSVVRQAIGANIVLLFDRSSSMDNGFADRRPDGDEESKSAVAKRLVLDFLDRRPKDRIGVAAFSTTPMFVMPLSEDIEAVRGAVSAIDKPGLAYTDVGRGLILALGMFEENTDGASRALVLISDGAGVVGREVQDALRAAVKRNPVNLYWLYIRSEGSYGIHEVPERKSDDTPQARPERHLHIFLQSLGIPYMALEAQSPEAIEEAIAAIDRLESKPISYREAVAKTELASPLYVLATLCFGLLALAAVIERPLVPTGRLADPDGIGGRAP